MNKMKSSNQQYKIHNTQDPLRKFLGRQNTGKCDTKQKKKNQAKETNSEMTSRMKQAGKKNTTKV